MDCHAQLADALSPKADGRSQHQIGSIRLEQICRTNVSIESLGNQCHDVHQRFGGLTLLRRKVGDLLQSEDVWTARA
jgi:hypothetical protein